MVSFVSDYITGAHPKVLERLISTNTEALPGYGADVYCTVAADKIRKACGMPQAEVEFLIGGTQTNAVVISTLLADFEGVICADTGHIDVHESGAVEYTGHKILRIGQKDGKISAGELEGFVSGFYADPSREHMVFPGMVYVSQPTEYGTVYTVPELEEIYGVCRRYGMKFFIDGARLAYALACRNCGMSLADIARLCDVFYIGGTKAGALCGEAVVFTGCRRPAHFTASVKRRGALLAKGRLLGVQFDALFSDGLYFEIGAHADAMAEKIRDIFVNSGMEMYVDSPTNQQFVILGDDTAEKLARRISFGLWEKCGNGSSVFRFVTGWSTEESDIEALRLAVAEAART